jgi:hypothetical protein
MTIYEAAMLFRTARHPQSDLERDLALSRIVLVVAKELAREHGISTQEAAKGMQDVIRSPVVQWP